MSLAVFELVQNEDGEIQLQAEDSDAPLLRLRFSDRLTEILGADALALAQAMVESASHAFEYARDESFRGENLHSRVIDQAIDQVIDQESEIDAETVIRLQTSPIH